MDLVRCYKCIVEHSGHEYLSLTFGKMCLIRFGLLIDKSRIEMRCRRRPPSPKKELQVLSRMPFAWYVRHASAHPKKHERCITISMIALIASPRLMYHVESLSTFNLDFVVFDMHLIDLRLEIRSHLLVRLGKQISTLSLCIPTPSMFSQHQRPIIAISGTIFSKKIAFGFINQTMICPGSCQFRIVLILNPIIQCFHDLMILWSDDPECAFSGGAKAVSTSESAFSDAKSVSTSESAFSDAKSVSI